jgi:hypothetical protein
VGRKLRLLGIGVYIKKKKKNICIKNLKTPHQKIKKQLEKALFKEKFKYFHKTGAHLNFAAR